MTITMADFYKNKNYVFAKFYGNKNIFVIEKMIDSNIFTGFTADNFYLDKGKIVAIISPTNFQQIPFEISNYVDISFDEINFKTISIGSIVTNVIICKSISDFM